MVAARRRTGSGIVVALVVFIVLSFLAIGASLWLLQQTQLMKRAIESNQAAFADSVGKLFAAQKGWSLPSKAGAEYALRYDADAFAAAAGKLAEAVNYEQMLALLGWESPEGVQGALEASPAQTEMPEKYRTLQGLLTYYENRYGELKKRVADLETEVATKRGQLVEQEREFKKANEDLRQRLNAAVAQYAKDLREARTQFDNMKKMYDDSRGELKQADEKFDLAQAEAKTEMAKLRKEADGWKELYEKSKAGEPAVKKMVAAGKVLIVEVSQSLVSLEGGEDVGRERNAELVIYSETPAGARTKKAEVTVTKVMKNTAQALIVEQTELPLAGDLFVSKDLWDQFNLPPVPPAPARPGTTTPAAPQPVTAGP